MSVAAVWSVSSPEWDPNVWRTECKGLAFKIYRFLEVYSENSSQHRRLWRHTGRTNRCRLFRFVTARGSSVTGSFWRWKRFVLTVNSRDSRVETRPLFSGLCSSALPAPPFHPVAPAFAEPALAPRNRAAASPYPLSRNNCRVDSAPPGGPDRAFILGIHRLNIKDNRNAHRLFPVI